MKEFFASKGQLIRKLEAERRSFNGDVIYLVIFDDGDLEMIAGVFSTEAEAEKMRSDFNSKLFKCYSVKAVEVKHEYDRLSKSFLR